MASNLTTGRINVFSDHAIDEVDPALTVHSNGTPKQNIAITYASWENNKLAIQLSQSGSSKDVRIQITDHTREVEVPLLEQIVEFSKDNETLELQTNNKHRIIRINLDLDNTDGLQLDNNVWLVRPLERPINIASDLSTNWGYLLGIASEEKPAPIFRLHTNMSMSTPMKSDLLFTNRNIGGSSNTWRIRFPMLGETTLSTGNFQIQRSHPLLYNIQLSNVLWEYDPSKRIRGTPLIEIDSVAVLSEEEQGAKVRRGLPH